MPLNIRDPRAAVLARDLAQRRKTTMTEAIIAALEAEIARERERTPLDQRIAVIADDLAAQAKTGGHALSKDEIDDMWGM